MDKEKNKIASIPDDDKLQESQAENSGDLDLFDIDEIYEESVQESEVQESSAREESDGEKNESTNSFYALIEGFGNALLKCTGIFIMFFVRLLSKPLRKLGIRLSVFGKRADVKIRKYLSVFVSELSVFGNEIKSARQTLKGAVRHPVKFSKLFFNYVKKGLSNHDKLLRTVANFGLPVVAAAVLVLAVSYWNGVTFALEVTYNNQSIGYISDESVYIEAQEMIEEKLDTGALTLSQGDAQGASSTDFLNAEYQLKIVSLEELNDAQTICDRVIENSADNLINACGVYIDGEFAGAIKNEADAKTVFYNILEPYEQEAQQEGYVVGFAENIDYVQGLYSDSSKTILDAVQFEELLNSEKKTVREYTVQSGDSLESIADDFSMDTEELEALNEGFDWDDIRKGDTVQVEETSKYVRIQKTVTSTDYEEVDYDSVITRDATKYSGYQKITKAGVEGLNRVTTTRIYIDGVLDSVEEETVVIREPVAEEKTVGTKSYYGGVTVSPSASGFLWPAPSCNYVSSPYGYRRSGFHKGIDLCKSGGGASGTSVIASKAGTVEFAGWSEIGYGYLVTINHGGGYKTRYAHMLKMPSVSTGEKVYAGQVIGQVGSTGNSTGPHLHFEILYYGEHLNPGNYISR